MAIEKEKTFRNAVDEIDAHPYKLALPQGIKKGLLVVMQEIGDRYEAEKRPLEQQTSVRRYEGRIARSIMQDSVFPLSFAQEEDMSAILYDAARNPREHTLHEGLVKRIGQAMDAAVEYERPTKRGKPPTADSKLTSAFKKIKSIITYRTMNW